MAKFNTGNSPAEAVPGSRPKVSVQPTKSVGSLQAKRAALEGSLSGSTTSNTPPKPNFLKSSGPPKTPDEKNDKDPAFPKLKPTANKFGGNQNTLEESKPTFPKQPLKPKLSEAPKESEAKPMFPKPPLQKATGSSNLQDKETKPAFPKPAAVSKPPWLTDTAKAGETSTTSATSPKMPLAPKPKSSFKVLKAQADEGTTTDPAAKPFSGVSLKPSDAKPLNARNAFLAKLNQDSSDEAAPSRKPPPQKLNFAAHKPDFPRKPSALGAQKENSDPSAPKRNPLPNIFALGSPPAKPNRPPNVNLEQFKKGAVSTIDAPAPGLKKATPPPPPPPSSAHPSSQPALPLTSHPSAAPSPPNLPPSDLKITVRHAKEQLKVYPMLKREHFSFGTFFGIQPDPDENYDDVGHPGQNQEDGSDEEMYEDLEERWSSKESKELEKKREKEEKKRLEQEKKEQKEREKKEQDLKKRFKLTGPLEVIHKVKARVDCKGGKNDLMIKQGEAIDIIRITDNPEGRWLGRNKDGSYGYVKTESVEIDYDTLKRKPFGLTVSDKQPEDDGELYDDVASNEEVNSAPLLSGGRGPGVVLPPPPEEEDDIYHDPDNTELNVSAASQEDSKEKSWPWGLLKIIKGKDDKKKTLSDNNEDVATFLQAEEQHIDIDITVQVSLWPCCCCGNIYRDLRWSYTVPLSSRSSEKAAAPVDDEIYDDVESTPFPPPPLAFSLPKLKAKDKTEEKDLKKQKKFEKEEKEFRKKFKYDGEIQVLYQVTIVSTLTNKKWGGKDLPLKPGEVVDVIQKPVDNKMICRNEDGKCEFGDEVSLLSETSDTLGSTLFLGMYLYMLNRIHSYVFSYLSVKNTQTAHFVFTLF
ncbi:FYB1 protein, partial [Atractosteus spatula]|nr:FYB1 protein [Atractosteus spatula]